MIFICFPEIKASITKISTTISDYSLIIEVNNDKEKSISFILYILFDFDEYPIKGIWKSFFNW